MALSSYDLKTNLREKTAFFLQDASRKNYNLLRQLCLDLKPIEAVLVELNKELESLYQNDIKCSKTTLTEQACANQQTLDTVEDARDNIQRQQDQKAFDVHTQEHDGTGHTPGMAVQIEQKQAQIKQKRQQIQSKLQTNNISPVNLGNESDILLEELTSLQKELRILHARKETLHNKISDYKQRIAAEYSERECERVARQAARNNPPDFLLLQLSEVVRRDLNEKIKAEHQKLTKKYNALITEGRKISFAIYLNALEDLLTVTMPPAGRALCDIIKNIQAHIVAKNAEASAQSQLSSCKLRLSQAQHELTDRQLEIIIDCNTLGLVTTSQPEILAERFDHYRQELVNANRALEERLRNVPLYIGLSLVVGLVLGVSALAITTQAVAVIALYSATILFFIVCIERAIFYSRTSAVIHDNQQKIHQYTTSHNNIIGVIPKLIEEIRNLNDQQLHLPRIIDKHSQDAVQFLASANAIQLDNASLPNSPRRSDSPNSFFYHDGVPVVMAIPINDEQSVKFHH